MRSIRWTPLPLALLLGVALACPILRDSGAVHAATEARATPSGEGVELEYTGRDGTPVKTIFPIYQVGAIKYFSTGMGADERSAVYPPYPLKLIFIAGPKSFLAQVAVTITDARGSVNLLVPGEQVTGPWLFVDLPAGAYDITAIRRDRSEVKQHVKVATGGTKTVYFRWKE